MPVRSRSMVSPSASSQSSPRAVRSTDKVRRNAARAFCSSFSGQSNAASVARRCGCPDTAKNARSAVALRVSVTTILRPTSVRGAPSKDTRSSPVAIFVTLPGRSFGQSVRA